MKNIKIRIGLTMAAILFLSGCSFPKEILDNVDQTSRSSSPMNGGYLEQMGEISQQAKQNIQVATEEQNKKISSAMSEGQEGNNQQSNSQINNSQNNQMDNTELTKKYSAALIKTNLGNIKVKFYNADSPITVGNFLKLSQDGFYSGTKFHRVIKDFMIQGGDPNSKDDDWSNDGQGGPGYSFQDEFNSHKLVKGSLAMANSRPNTNGSQFFIVTAAATAHLDGKHTNFGEVVEGMDVVTKIENVAKNSNDHPTEDVTIQSIELLEK
jgi:peptidyl-prolyl cis-trans isomerase B (cyclophilin B)